MNAAERMLGNMHKSAVEEVSKARGAETVADEAEDRDGTHGHLVF